MGYSEQNEQRDSNPDASGSQKVQNVTGRRAGWQAEPLHQSLLFLKFWSPPPLHPSSSDLFSVLMGYEFTPRKKVHLKPILFFIIASFLPLTFFSPNIKIAYSLEGFRK